MLIRREKLCRVAIAVATFGLLSFAGSAQAGEILNFNPEPISPSVSTYPEFVWSATGLTTGNGATSNGDGHLYGQPGFSVPGLTVSVPFVINGVSGSEVGASNTSFYDVSLSITSGFAPAMPVLNFGGFLLQNIGSGSFELRSTNNGSGTANTLLLSGTVSTAVMSGVSNTNVGSVTSSEVAYTGGLVYDAMVDAGYATTGSFSWTLLDITSKLAQSGNYVRAFSANSNGTFAAELAIPEPGMAAMACLAGLALVRRRR